MDKPIPLKFVSVCLFGLLLLTGLACVLPFAAAPQPTLAPEPTQAAPNPTSPLETLPSPTAQPTAPELTLPATPYLSSTPPATNLTATPDLMQVNIFLIAMQDEGKSGPAVGCGDSAVPVVVLVPRTQGVLRAALDRLLSMKDQYFGEFGLYNALYQSNLKVDAVRIENEKATVELSGTLLQGGECDSPRIQAQLEQTALQFSTVKSVAVFINGVPIEEVLSLR